MSALSRRISAVLLPVLLSGLVQHAVAQPAVLVSTDVVAFPVERQFAVTNVGADTLWLSFPSTEDLGGKEWFIGTVMGYGWGLEAQTPDSTYSDIYLPYEQPEFLPGIALAPDVSAQFEILFIDPCPVCRPGGLPSDTLYLRAIDAVGADTVRVVLDLANYVATEPALGSALALDVYPNPASSYVFVAWRGRSPEPVTAALLDLLGRTVRTLNLVPGASLRVALDGLAPGTYYLHARTPGGTTVRRLTIVPE